MNSSKKKFAHATTHYRTWKSGKSWLYAASVLTTLVGGAAVSQTIEADTLLTATNTSIPQPASSAVASSSVPVANISYALVSPTAVSTATVPYSSSSTTPAVQSVTDSIAAAPTTTLLAAAATTSASSTSLASSVATTPGIISNVSLVASSMPSLGSSVLNTSIENIVSQAITTVGISGLATIINSLSTVFPGLAPIGTILNTVSAAASYVGVIQSTVASLQAQAASAVASINVLISDAQNVANGLGLGSQFATAVAPVTSLVNSVSSLVAMTPAQAWDALAAMPAVTTPDITIGGIQLLPPITLIPSGQVITQQLTTALGLILGVDPSDTSDLPDMHKILTLQGQDLMNYLAVIVTNSAIDIAGKGMIPTVTAILNPIPFIGPALVAAVTPLFNDLDDVSLQQLINASAGFLAPILGPLQNILNGIMNAFVNPVITTKNTMMFVGNTWTPAMNFVSGVYGLTPLIISSATASQSAVYNTPGAYTINYNYTDSATAKSGSSVAILTVVATPTITAPANVTLKVGDVYTPGVATVTDSMSALDGGKLNPPTGNVDTSKAGVYQEVYTYTYTDPTTNVASTISATQTVTVVASTTFVKPTITAPANQTLTVGQTYTQSSATVVDPQAATDGGVLNAPTGVVDTTKAGTYTVTHSYTYNDPTLGSQTIYASQIVTVVAAPTSTAPVLVAKSLIYTVGDASAPMIANAFVSGTDSEGKALTVSQVTAVGFDKIPVDANGFFTTAGTYQVHFYYLDPVSGIAGASNIVTITVDPANVPFVTPTITAPADVTLKVGQTFTPGQAIVNDPQSATDNGTLLAPVGNVDTTKPGVYTVTYSYRYTDPVKGVQVVSATQTVTVNQVQTQSPVINVVSGSVAIYSSQTYQDNLVLLGATDSEGNPVPLANIVRTITTSTGAPANLSVAGTYTVTYSYTDPTSGLTGTAKGTIIVRQDDASTGW